MMLSTDQERDLIRRAQRGDDAARDRLWVVFHRLAVAEGRRLALAKGADPDEAEGAAAIAIPEAIDRFDLRRNVRFSTYLAQRLTGTTTTLARTERRQTRFDTAQFQPGPPVPEHQDDKPPPGCFW